MMSANEMSAREIRDEVAGAWGAGTDEEKLLLEELRLGSEWAFEVMVRNHRARLLAVAGRFLRCDEDAADAVQEAFISAFQSMDSFTGTSRLSTWLHRIVVNASLMKIRARSRRPEVQPSEEQPEFDSIGVGWRMRSSGPLRHVECAELRDCVRQCIEELPASYRDILKLRDIEERDTEETARLLGESCANVKTRLHRARHALRQRIQPFFHDGMADDSN